MKPSFTKGAQINSGKSLSHLATEMWNKYRQLATP